MSNRPSFLTMWANFQQVKTTVAGVGVIIGGRVGDNIKAGIFTNACAIRVSYALNHSGHPIVRGRWKTSSGADGKWYVYRVSDLVDYLTSRFGPPDLKLNSPTTDALTNKRGILVFLTDQWATASGHATLWNGTICADSCYFPESTEALLWYLE